jgi:hypothetical protein
VKGLVKPLEFVGFSVPLFLLWEYVLRQPYLVVLAQVFAASARLFGRGVHVDRVAHGEIHLSYLDLSWVDQFGLTGINVVALSALILATRVAWKKRLRMLGIGIGLLFATQVLGLWTDIVHAHLHTRPGAVGFANALRAFMTGFGTFLFPVLIWLWLVWERLPLGETPAHPAPAAARRGART